MAKPRVFVSSTYYDLRHVRERIEDFVTTIGYEAILFESGDIPFRSDSPLDHSCYSEIENCHMLVLIIGGRYGSPASGEDVPQEGTDREKFFMHYNSITKKEYEAAATRDIPIFIFVDQGVMGEYQTYKNNRKSGDIAYAHVDSVNIFVLLDDILGRARNNYVKAFSRIDDITTWLREQWAGLFSDMISRQREQTEIASISSRLEELQAVTDGLKTYSEELLKGTLKAKSKKVISDEAHRLKKVTKNRFARSMLVRYVMKNTVKDKPASIDDAYRALEESTSFEDFLNRLAVKSEIVESLQDGRIPNRDYRRLRADFCGASAEEFDISDIGLSREIVRLLRDAGLDKVSDLMSTNLTSVPGIGAVRAKRIEFALRRLSRDM